MHTHIDSGKNIANVDFDIDMLVNVDASSYSYIDLSKGIVDDDIFTDAFVSYVCELGADIVQSYGLILKLDDPFREVLAINSARF